MTKTASAANYVFVITEQNLNDLFNESKCMINLNDLYDLWVLFSSLQKTK